MADDPKQRRHDRFARPRTAVPVEVDEECTGKHEGEELAALRARRPTPDRFRRLEDKHDALASAIGQVKHVDTRLDRLDRVLEKLDDRLDKYAERVVRAEQGGDGAWSAVKALGPQLTEIQQQLGEVSRIGESVDKISGKLDEHGRRFAEIETEQRLAAQRFEAHDKRDQEIAGIVERIDKRVLSIEQARSTETAIVKHEKATWSKTKKGVVGALVALATAAATYLSGGGCT